MKSSALLVTALLVAAAGCSGKKAKVAEAAVAPEPAALPPVVAPTPTAPPETPVAAARREAVKPKLKLSLRSTPVGAVASVDGRSVGPTPLVHEVDDDGRAHEFTFVLDGYAMERYKFPPIRDGVIHAKLRPIPAAPDAGPTAQR